MPAYMQYGKIKGPMKGKYKDWIELSGLQFGIGRGISTPIGFGTKRESSPPGFGEFTITKKMDSSSAALYTEALSGKGQRVKIDLVRPDALQSVYMRYEFEEAMVSAYSLSSGGDLPMESMAITFAKVTYTLAEGQKP